MWAALRRTGPRGSNAGQLVDPLIDCEGGQGTALSPAGVGLALLWGATHLAKCNQLF